MHPKVTTFTFGTHVVRFDNQTMLLVGDSRLLGLRYMDKLYYEEEAPDWASRAAVRRFREEFGYCHKCYAKTGKEMSERFLLVVHEVILN